MAEFLDVPGGRIAYDVTGSGPVYRFLAPKLAQAGYRVANADLRGHGEFSMGWASITRTDVAGDLCTGLSQSSIATPVPNAPSRRHDAGPCQSA